MPEFVLFSLLIFDDDTWSASPFYRGTLAKCKDCADSIPAVSYQGEKRVIKSTLQVVPLEAWNRAIEALRR